MTSSNVSVIYTFIPLIPLRDIVKELTDINRITAV